MIPKLDEEIRREARKLICRHQRYATEVHDELNRIERRSGVRPLKVLRSPEHWKRSPGFDPYHVFYNAPAIAHAISNALRRRTYEPKPPVDYAVPREGSSPRTVSIFQIADNTVSRVFFKRLLAKNASRMSSRCYAYRTDITLHDEIGR